jgi:hypothetical protein
VHVRADLAPGAVEQQVAPDRGVPAIDERSDAACAIATLLHLAPIGVEDAVIGESSLAARRFDDERLVETNPGVAGRELAPLLDTGKRAVARRIEHDEVVAEAVHFRELELHEARILYDSAMRVGPWIVAAVLVFGAYRWYNAREIDHLPGVLASEEPWQSSLEAGAGIERGGFRLLPRAEFGARVRILRREDYSVGALASLVPTDFAVGWGPMSDSGVLAGIEISQGNRFYYWRTDTWPIPREQIERHSANWHVIAENEAVRVALDKLNAGSVVELRGRLVDIEGRDAGMRTSLSRTDTGAGACEILLASSVQTVDAG